MADNGDGGESSPASKVSPTDIEMRDLALKESTPVVVDVKAEGG
jgi:hypothetical protein